MSLTMGKKENTKTPGFLERLFKKKSSQTHDSRTSRRSTLDKTSSRESRRPEDNSSTTELRAAATAVDKEAGASKSKTSSSSKSTSCRDCRQPSIATAQDHGTASAAAGAAEGPVQFPTTPESMLARHRARPYLDADELATLEDLDEFECLVGGVEVIRAAARHARYFGVEPARLWEEFFRFVSEGDADYDDVIDAHVWRQFTDRKYPC